jgi:hypothetical protein
MAHQFIPSLHGRSSNSFPRDTSTSPTSFANDWHAQQSLLMGSNNASFHQRQVSFSPISHHQDNLMWVQPHHPSSSIHTHNPNQGRVVYASNHYQYGNPCYYYDPSNYPTSVSSQANIYVPPTEVHRTNLHTPTSPSVFHNAPEYMGHTVHTTSPHFPTNFDNGNNFGYTPGDGFSTTSQIPPEEEDHHTETMPDSIHVQHVGCQASSSEYQSNIIVTKEAKKLSLPPFDPSKLSWSSYAMKLHAALIECDLSYLLKEPCTTVQNGIHSKELMLELFKKLQGGALALFTSMNAQLFYMEGGWGIEMLHALVNKYHRLDNRAIQNIINAMQTLQLQDYEDLSVYHDKLENYNLQLSWVGQEMSSSFLVFLAQSQLAKS